MPPIETDGAKGAEKFLMDTTNQLKGVMARTACKDLSAISEDIIWHQER